ncbi:hypothetical protein CBP51_11410 [Cellvibrio mixtus]|uniref:Uncharacterized protein n=1 Tax=Cellvibrio mixtus TaxID=39650 RepID=A0A266QCH5_9GAMM|nr:pentapeptide repeat-containing protein [Cellvibrio mixtus]OZY87545.1 hypothetical protein CBP51_11410 [Cellvibrio mixtus]
MQRLKKNLAISAFGKIRNSLKTGVIRQMETFFELMSEDGLVNLGQIRDELYPQSEKGSANASFNRFIKQINEELAEQGSRARLAITADKKAGDKRDCWFEAEPVQPPIPHTPQLDAIPEDQLEQAQLGLPMLDVDIVLITFNQHELEQTLRCFCPDAPAVQMEGHNRVYYQLGKHGGQNLVLIHSRQATLGAMKSAEIAIEVFHPNAVIALGIAFGINSGKQQIGEVLISESITTYELARINKDGSITSRGPRPPASKNLRDWFHQLDAYLNASNSAEYAKRYIGSMFSGDKLIDNENYRDQLLKIDPEAIGGEMEGSGIFHACEESGTDWIVVKAICDFADGNKGKNKDANQKIAAENAARLVKAALEFGNLYPTKKVFSSEKLHTKHSLKNFHDYTANCTNLHEIDERALVKDALPTTLKKEQAALLEQEHTNGIPVVARLLDWAQEPQAKSVFAILGEYGMGKTISCQLFDKQLRSLLTQNKLLPVPLYFDLRHVTSKTLADGFHFPDIIKDCIRFGWLKSDSSEEFTTSDIERWANQSGVVLIFDGLDEVLVKLSESDGRIFTDQLYKFQAELKANSKQPVKMLLTCRSQYFKTLDRQKDHFTGQERGGVSADDIEAMVMLPLTEEQITNYLRHALPGIDPATIIDMVKSVHDLHDLSKRPFTLKLVGEFFPALEEDRKAGKAISGVSLYRRVVDRWLNRDDGKHHIKSDHKLQLASHLAALLWRQKQSALSASEIENWFMGWLMDNPTIAYRYKTVEPELLEEDLRTATFLCREDDEQGSRFRFSHTSLQEYFLANYLLQAISDNKPEHWVMAKPSRETLVFLAQLLAEPENKSLLFKLSEWRKAYRQSTSENLLHYALVAYELGFSLPVLNGIQLAGADLAELSITAKSNNLLSLASVNFSGANLRRARFSVVNLDGANFSEAILDNAEFDQCSLNNSQWPQTEMAATRFFRCSLAAANLATAKVHRSRLLDCNSLPEAVQQHPQWLINQPTISIPETHDRYSHAGHNGWANTCALSADGRYLVSGSGDASLRLWELSSGECVREFIGHSSGVTSCALSADGRYLVSGSGDKSLRLWNLGNGECEREYIGHEGGVTSCALSADGRYLVSGSNDNSLRLWELSSGECVREFIGHNGGVTSCALSADGCYLVSGSEDASLRLWELSSDECVREFIGHDEGVTSCALSVDDRYLVSGSWDRSLRLWELTSGECVHEFMGHESVVTSCALSADGRYLVSGSWDESLRLWELSSGECVREFIGHHNWVLSCALSADGRYLVSGFGDASLRLWELSSGECIREFFGHGVWVGSCALSADGRYLVSGSWNNSLRLWELNSGECVREFTGHERAVTSCALSADGRYLVSGSWDNSLRLWELNSGECVREFTGHERAVTSCALSADGRYLVSGSRDKSLRLWNLSSGECVREFIGHEGAVTNCALSTDGRYLVSGSGDNSLRLWELSSGNYVREFIGHSGDVTSCALSADGCYLVSGSEDASLRLWELSSGECVREFIGHDNGVTSCALSADDRYLVSGSGDDSLRLWELSSGECVREFIGHKQYVTSCALSADGHYLVSSSSDSTVRYWSLETGETIKVIFHAPESNYLTTDGNQQTILAKSEYAWRYFNGYFINEKGEPDSFPVI